MTATVRLLSLALIPMLLLAACGPLATATSSQEAAATSSPAASSTPGASVSTAVPAGFPVMPASEAVLPLPDDPQLLARWTTTASGAQVYDFYVHALPAAGFRIDQLAPGGEAAIIRVSRPAGPPLEVSLTAQGDGTRIDLRLSDAAAD
jgi:hypothetical protein